MMTLTERIDKSAPPPKRLPRWVERMQRQGLPVKDLTPTPEKGR